MAKRGTKWVLEYARLAMGFANVWAGTRVLMLVLVQAVTRAVTSGTKARPLSLPTSAQESSTAAAASALP